MLVKVELFVEEMVVTTWVSEGCERRNQEA